MQLRVLRDVAKKPTLRRQKASLYEQASIRRSVDHQTQIDTDDQDDHTYAALKRLSKLPPALTENQYGLLEDPAAIVSPAVGADVYAELERPTTQFEDQRSRDNSIGSYSYIDSDTLSPNSTNPTATMISVQSAASATTERSYTYIDPPHHKAQQVAEDSKNLVEQGNVNHAYDDVCSNELYSPIRKKKPLSAFEGEMYEFVTVTEK